MPSSYAPLPLTPIKGKKRKAVEISNSSPHTSTSADKESIRHSPHPTTDTSAAASNDMTAGATAASSHKTTTPGNTKIAQPSTSSPSQRAKRAAATETDLNDESSCFESTYISPDSSPGGGRTRKKAKTTHEQLAEAENAVRDPSTGEACPIAAANYTINRLNREGSR